MRVGIYARVSTAEQSCEAQLRDLRLYCTARGWAHIEEFVDVGVSGAKDSRPQLNKLMDAVRKRKLDVVLVWRFDRFARSTKHLLLALEEFRLMGVGFISYNENIDTSSPLGMALFTIISAVAQLERDIIKERIAAGIRNARARGVQLGRPKRRVNPKELMELKAEGKSVREIAKEMRIGYGTARDRLAKGERKTPPPNRCSPPKRLPPIATEAAGGNVKIAARQERAYSAL